jgi:hypothetical protein
MNPRFSLLIAVSSLVAVGCNEYGIVEDPNNVDVLDNDLSPNIEVQPTEVTFGQVNANSESSQVINILNRGRRPSHPPHRPRR